MNNQLTQKFLDWLNATESFIIEQAPDIAQQMLAWGSAESTIDLIWAALFMTVAVACGVIVKKFYRRIDDSEVTMGFFICSLLIGPILFGGSLIMAGIAIQTKVQIAVAPKVYLIDQLTK